MKKNLFLIFSFFTFLKAFALPPADTSYIILQRLDDSNKPHRQLLFYIDTRIDFKQFYSPFISKFSITEPQFDSLSAAMDKIRNETTKAKASSKTRYLIFHLRNEDLIKGTSYLTKDQLNFLADFTEHLFKDAPFLSELKNGWQMIIR